MSQVPVTFSTRTHGFRGAIAEAERSARRLERLQQERETARRLLHAGLYATLVCWGLSLGMLGASLLR